LETEGWKEKSACSRRRYSKRSKTAEKKRNQDGPINLMEMEEESHKEDFVSKNMKLI